MAERKWLVCNCLGNVDTPPVLFFSNDHIVRHRGHGSHTLICPFKRTATEQRAIVKSFRERPSDPLSLVRAFRRSAARPRETVYLTPSTPRNSPAALLATLLTESGIQLDTAGVTRPTLIDQHGMIEAVARTKRLDNRVPLADFLSFDATSIELFKQHIAALDPRWSASKRAHGMLITTVEEVR
jgi:hypothetical protein